MTLPASSTSDSAPAGASRATAPSGPLAPFLPRAIAPAAPLIPALATILVAVLYFALRAVLHLCEIPLDACRDPCLVPQAKLTAAASHWASALFVSSCLMVAVVAAALRGLATARPRRRHLAGLGACMLALLLGQALLPRYVASPLTWTEVHLLEAANSRAGSVLIGFLVAVNCTALLVCAAVAALLWRASRRSVRIEEVAATRGRIHGLLMLCTSWLVAGVIGAGLFHGLVSHALAPASAAALDVVRPAATVWTGVLYSGMLAALFVPAELILRGLADRCREGSTATEPEREKWLSENGFDLSVPLLLAKVGAIFAPLLAGALEGIARL